MYSRATPEDRAAGIAAMGSHTAEHLERTLGELARQAVALGARRVVVAGGETFVKYVMRGILSAAPARTSRPTR
jgi:uncharacterized protein YgbK (DUF1537 family)